MAGRAEVLRSATFAVLLAVIPGTAFAQTRGRDGTVFFDASVGAAVARVDSPGVSGDPQLGVSWRVGVGWSPSALFAVGFSFATWQRSALGTPIHLHALGPRFEITPSGGDGLVTTLAVEYAETDGDAPKRYGGALTPSLGYRFRANRWLSPTLRFGADLALYDGGGSALVPFVELELRVYGRTR